MTENAISRVSCGIEDSFIPKVASSLNFISHSVDTEAIDILLQKLAHNLLDIPVSLKVGKTQEELGSSSVFLTLSPFTCTLQILGLHPLNRSLVTEDEHLTPLNMLISSNKVVYDEPEEINLLKMELGKPRKTAQVSDDSQISCAFKHPDLLVKETQCLSMLQSITTKNSLTNNIGELRKQPHYPGIIVQGKSELKPYTFPQILVCADSQLKINTEELFYEFDNFYIKAEQICKMFSIECNFLKCGLDIGGKSLDEIDRMAKCLLHNTKSNRVKRDVNIFSGLLEGLGLTRSASQISIDHFNKVNKANFDKLKESQLNLEKALIQESENMHSLLAQEGKSLAETYDKTNILSSHFNLVVRLQHHRSYNLASLKAFAQAFRHISKTIDDVMKFALAPLHQNGGAFCDNAECIDIRSLILKTDKNKITVSARLLEIQAMSTGRISCELFNINGSAYVHGLQDHTVVRKDKSLYDFSSNKEVTQQCLSTGLNCPHSMRPVSHRDLMMENIYFSVHKGTMRAQCLETTIFVTSTNNISCTMSSVEVSPPFVVLGERENHLVEAHNLHTYYSIPRKMLFADEKIVHRLNTETFDATPPPLQAQTANDTSSFSDFKPFENIWTTTITITPYFLLVVLLLCCVCCAKYPAIPKTCWKCVKTCCCCKNSQQEQQVDCRTDKNKKLDSIVKNLRSGHRSPPSYEETSFIENDDLIDNKCKNNLSSRNISSRSVDKHFEKSDRAVNKLGDKINK